MRSFLRGISFRLLGLVVALIGFWFAVGQALLFPNSLGSVWVMRFPPIPIPYAGNIFWGIVGLAGLAMLLVGRSILSDDSDDSEARR